MTDLKQTVAELEQRLQASLAERDELLQQRAATNEVLQVINASSGDLAPVFDAILERAMRLCEAEFGLLATYDGRQIRTVATRGVPPAFAEFRKNNPPDYGPGTGPARILAGERVVHIADLKSGDAYRTGDPNRRAVVDLGGARTVLLVPLLKNESVLGYITIYRKEVRPYSDKQIVLLQNFADQAMIAIQNARLFNETQEALERQTATAEILKVIASSPADVQPVFHAIATSANRLIGGHSTTVLRIVGDMAELAAFTSVSPEADAALRALFPRPIFASDMQLAQVLQGEVMEIADTEGASELITRNLARARGFRSRLLVPLRSDNDVLGVISITRKEPGAFAKHDVELLQTFADQAVIAIENARLFDEVKTKTDDLTESLQQQTATADVLKVISASPGELEPVFKAMLENAVRLCDAKFAMLILYEKKANEFRGVASWNVPPAYSAALGKKAIQADPKIPLGRVVMTKRPVQVADVLVDQSYIDRYPGMVDVAELGGARTLLQVPMLKENELVGTIAIYRQEVRPFPDKQIELVQNFAAQAVIAIENARLLNELRQRTDDLSQSLDDLRTAQDRLVQTEKLASLGQLTAGIAHEIKNPLNFVNNFSALSAELTGELTDVLKPVAMDGRVRGEVDELTGLLKDNLEKIVQHGRRADSIVKNMLLHSREGSGEQRTADINALLDESLNLAYHGARAEKPGFNITLQRDFDVNAGAIELFPQEITRAFLNLISNGFYAATMHKNENGDPDFEPVLSAATKNLGSSVEIRIRDNGMGIPPEVKDKIFNPFFTTKPAGEGTGLGLSMSHDIIVKQHGGRIEIETEPGQFTEFRIVLPRAGASLIKSGERS